MKIYCSDFVNSYSMLEVHTNNVGSTWIFLKCNFLRVGPIVENNNFPKGFI